jgi:hypothetical protein
MQVIARSYPLDRAAEAHKRLANRHVPGKTVLKIRD